VRAHNFSKITDLFIQYMPVKKQQGVKGLILGGCRKISINGQMRQKICDMCIIKGIWRSAVQISIKLS